jgi:hypothetical protein
VRGDENDRHAKVFAKSPAGFKTIYAAHFNVEQDQVRWAAFSSKSFQAGLAGINAVDFKIELQRLAHAFRTDRIVVYHQYLAQLGRKLLWHIHDSPVVFVCPSVNELMGSGGERLGNFVAGPDEGDSSDNKISDAFDCS